MKACVPYGDTQKQQIPKAGIAQDAIATWDEWLAWFEGLPWWRKLWLR